METKAAFHRWIQPLLVAVMGALPACAQTVTFGGPPVSGVPQQVGGIVTSTPLLNIQSTAGIATNKLGTFYLSDSTGNAVYSFVPATASTTALYTKLNFQGLNQPGNIAVDGAGDVYVCDTGNDRIVERTAAAKQQTIAVPQSGVPDGIAVDGSGNLYFSAIFQYNNPGAVFKLAAGSSTPVQIGSGLSNPEGLSVDGAGNLFIADYSNERIVEISAAGVQSTALSLTNFPAHVMVDNNDTIFTDGAANGDLVEVRAGMSEQVVVLPTVLPGYSNYTLDGDDNVFAVGGFAGTGAGPTFYESATKVISLPQANVCQTGGNAPSGGSSGCTSSVTLNFWIWSSVNLGTPRVLTQGAAGLDFTQNTSVAPSCAAGQITLTAGESATCAVVVNFTPQAAGIRKGAVQIVDSSGDVLAQLFLYGLGVGPQLSITPSSAAGVTNTLPFSAPNTGLLALGTDAAGNVYITDGFGSTSEIYKISPAGTQTSIPISNVFSPGRVEVDGAGDLYLPGGYGDYEFPSTGSSSSTPPATLISNLHGDTEGLALDGLGDADMVTDNAGLGTGSFYRSTLDGSVVLVASASNSDLFGDVVEDAWLNTADTGGHFTAPIVGDGGNLMEVSLLEQSFESFLNLQTLNANFGALPQGSGVLAVSPGGDIYFDEGSSVYDTAGRNLTSAVGGGVTAFTIDSQANLYAIAVDGSAAPKVVEVPAIQQPFGFPATTAGSSSSTQVFTVFNSGNAPMTFSSIAASGPFALDSSKTSCSNAQPLTATSSCTIGVKFSPTATGPATGGLTVAVAGLVTPQFVLTGTGTAAATLLTPTTTAMTVTPNPASFQQTVNFAVNVTGSGTTPTGTVTIGDGSTTLAIESLVSGAATYTNDSLAPGQYTLTAGYSGDSNNDPSTSAAVTLTVAPIMVQLAAPSSTAIAAGGSLSASVSIGSANNYAGPVSLACTVSYQGTGTASDAPSCAVSPSSVTLAAGGSATASLSVSTTAESAGMNSGSASVELCSIGLGGVLLCFCRRRRARAAYLAAFLLLVLLPGCNNNDTPSNGTPSNPGTGAGSYVVTLTSTAGQIATTQSFTFTVQ